MGEMRKNVYKYVKDMGHIKFGRIQWKSKIRMRNRIIYNSGYVIFMFNVTPLKLPMKFCISISKILSKFKKKI